MKERVLKKYSDCQLVKAQRPVNGKLYSFQHPESHNLSFSLSLFSLCALFMSDAIISHGCEEKNYKLKNIMQPFVATALELLRKNQPH